MLALGYLLLLLDRAAAAYAGPQVRAGLELVHVGLTGSILFLATLFFEVPSALIAGRVGVRRWLSVMLVVSGLATIATGLATGAAMFYTARVVAGLGQAAYLPAAVMLVVGCVPAAYRTRMLTWIVLVALLAGAFAPVSIGWLLEQAGATGFAGWRALFTGIGLACLPLALLLLRLPDPVRTAAWLTEAERDALAWARSVERRERPVEPGLSGLLDSRIVLLAAVNLGLSLSAFAAGAWYSVLVRDQVPAATLVTLAAVVVTAAVTLVWARRVDRDGRLLEGMVMACALATVAYAAGVFSGPVVTMKIGLVAHGATLAAARTMLWSAAGRLGLAGAGPGGIAVIDVTGMVAAFVAPRVVAGLAHQVSSLQLGILAVAGALLLATACAGLLAALARRA